ncbi:MAG: VWA domain-containing protein [Alphaproteobacteria bacterium]
MAEFDLDPLRDAQPPAPRSEAKAAALHAALQAFRQQQNNPQASVETERLPDAATIMAMQQPGEMKMKRSFNFNKLTLSLVLAGSVGLVGYVSMQQWQTHPGLSHAPVPATTAALVQQEEFERFRKNLAGEAQPLQPALADVKAKVSEEVAGGRNSSDAVGVAVAALPVPMPEKAAPSSVVVAEPVRRDSASVREGNAGAAASVVDRLEAKKEVLANNLPAASPPVAAGMMRHLVESDADTIATPAYHDFGRDKFDAIKDNQIMDVAAAPVSTFSIDVDSSSYAFTRRALNEGHLPQKDAVRVEEMINYFDYNYALPETREAPFKPSVTLLSTPWNAKTMLLHVGIKGFDLPKDHRPEANLVFLIDVSGSMNAPNKLPLAKNALKMLVDTLRPADHVAIVTYAGNAGTALESTAIRDKDKILQAIDNLGAGGSTAGAEGIRQAYTLAKAHFVKGGVNRVLLATDGDFNVGITDQKELQSYIERERGSGVFLSVLGFGSGNYNDALMQTLAQNGNGVAAYIDSLNEARRVLVDQANSTLFPIAKDVKIQVEFNPEMVSEYRLIGYENRMLQREDFNNDKVDAGEIGAGHAVTALYEITPKGGMKMVDDLRYGRATDEAKKEIDKQASGEYAFVKVRYKLPDGDVSKLITRPVTDADRAGVCPPNAKCDAAQPSEDVRFAASVAAFGQLLRGGKYTGAFTYDDVIKLAAEAKGKDEFGLRSEFVNLVRLAKTVPAMPQDR